MANREDIQERVGIMQAWLDGKVVQYMGVPSAYYGWQDLSDEDPPTDFGDFTYRIKPEPREIWVNEGDKCGTASYSENAAKAEADMMSVGVVNRTAVHYREVLEDE